MALARTNVANARVQLITAENNYETGKAQLNLAIGVEMPTTYDVSDETSSELEGEDQSLDDFLAEALKGPP